PGRGKFCRVGTRRWPSAPSRPTPTKPTTCASCPLCSFFGITAGPQVLMDLRNPLNYTVCGGRRSTAKAAGRRRGRRAPAGSYQSLRREGRALDLLSADPLAGLRFLVPPLLPDH